MKKITSTFVALFGILTFCTAENVGKTGENDNMKIEKSKLDLSLFKTDAEFMQTFRNFSDGEVPAYAKGKVEEKERNLAVLAALLGVQGKEEFEVALDKALDSESLTAVEAKEVIYQATAYLGFGNVRPFLDSANKIMFGAQIRMFSRA